MRTPFFRARNTILVLAAAFFISSCTAAGINSLARVDLFSISLGTLSDQLEWFYREGFRIAAQADIQYRDGRVYLSASSAGKIMIFSSYGELLTLIFDSGRNPVPRVNESGESSFSFQKWPLRTPFAIAVQNDTILVEDTVALNEGRNDRIILRFNSRGDYLEHLGQEGIGGSAFPPIWSVDVRIDQTIVITTLLNKVWKSFWYDKEGNLLTTLVIRKTQLPDYSPNDTVYSVCPHPIELAVYIRVDKYIQNGNNHEPQAMLYTFDMNSLEYSQKQQLRFGNGETKKTGFPAVPPEHLGVMSTGQHVLLSPEDISEYRLSLMDPEGRITQHKLITIDDDATVYRRFRLTPEGFLIGIFFSKEQADISLWRLDKLE